VTVRRHLLAGLAAAGLIHSATLEAFRAAGFLFDHAIRCPLPTAMIERERARARKYQSALAASGAAHLYELIEEWPAVWVMGHLARNSVAVAHPSWPRAPRLLTPPYVEPPKFFVSPYFRRFDAPTQINMIVDCFRSVLARTS
jgi:hypothetical protein